MCLYQPFEFISWAIAMRALLFTIILIVISLLNISSNKFLNQILCLAYSVKLTNSSSVVDRVTLFCCWDFYEIGLLLSVKIKPLVDLLVFFIICKIWIRISNESVSFLILLQIDLLIVPFKYCNMCINDL